jgi:predicted amidohydrolase
MYRVALAHLPVPATPAASVTLACDAVAAAAAAGARLVCFPECFVPGYRTAESPLPPPDAAFLDHAWQTVADAARAHCIAVILGTERLVGDRLRATALVIAADGCLAGFQDKVQLDPSEDATYAAGIDRRLFHDGPLTFGVVICHEGWRYPETVRWAARRGAHAVFHPHFHTPEPAPTFHPHAAVCRAAENTVYFASVNYAIPGAPTTAMVVSPGATILAEKTERRAGLLVADLDLRAATGLLAARCKY